MDIYKKGSDLINKTVSISEAIPEIEDFFRPQEQKKSEIKENTLSVISKFRKSFSKSIYEKSRNEEEEREKKFEEEFEKMKLKIREKGKSSAYKSYVSGDKNSQVRLNAFSSNRKIKLRSVNRVKMKSDIFGDQDGKSSKDWKRLKSNNEDSFDNRSRYADRKGFFIKLN